MKTAEEIKKGLECCIDGDAICTQCPYCDVAPECRKALRADYRALIQQLEAERDAAVNDLKCNWKCASCKNYTKPVTKCPHFHKCGLAYIHWEWRGVQKEVDHNAD